MTVSFHLSCSVTIVLKDSQRRIQHILNLFFFFCLKACKISHSCALMWKVELILSKSVIQVHTHFCVTNMKFILVTNYFTFSSIRRPRSSWDPGKFPLSSVFIYAEIDQKTKQLRWIFLVIYLFHNHSICTCQPRYRTQS